MNNQLIVAPIRTIRQAIAEIKAIDPESSLTETALRRMIIQGVIPSVKAGVKYLINMNILFDYLSNPLQFTLPPFKETASITKIRKIN